MRFISGRILFFIMAVLYISGAAAAETQNKYYRNFWQPEYRGQKLAYCERDHTDCGLCVATRYCRLMGYARADRQTKAHNVGLTNFFSYRATCQGWTCDGFKVIRCAGKISHKPAKPWHYRLRRFVVPRYNHYRIDWCYDGKKGCGHRVAKSFCRRMGFMDTRGYKIQKDIIATQAIGNQKLCFGHLCRAFAEINCYR